ncbi:MAG: metallophosphoesterase [Spirochaetes bacterium]|nr:metallophosphoesterase [Spirochaetota bacterium]MBU0956235.1 metallophosphoesterase [Spirochaetota bacterium]
MKILCVADNKDPLLYTNTVRTRFKDIDLILGAGDLDLDYYEFLVSSLNKPLLFVFGNHNLQSISRYRKEFAPAHVSFNYDGLNKGSNGLQYIGGSCKRVKNLLVAGLGGSQRYNKGLNQFTEFGMFLFSLRLLPRLLFNRLVHGRYLDILLTHAPPAGIHDLPDPCHRGFKFFLYFMRFFRPQYLIHGHVHLYDINAPRRTEYLDTTVINAYNHFVVQLEE